MRYVGLEHFDTGSPRITRWDSTDDILSASTEFVPGDVLFSKLRPYLRKVAIADFEGRCTNEALVYRPTDPQLLPSYLGLLLQSDAAISHADASSAGSRMPRTSVKLMASFPIELPPLVEQRRIVDLIAALDDTIQAAEGNLERISSFQDHFSGDMTRRARAEDWPATSLAEVLGGEDALRTGPFGSQLHKRDYQPDGEVPVVLPAAMKNRRVDLAATDRINRADANRLARHLTVEGDILWSRRGDVSRFAVIDAESAGSLCGTGCFLLRPEDPTSVRWLEPWLASPLVASWLEEHAVGATMKNLNRKILSRVPASLPPALERAALADAWEQLLDMRERATTGVARLATLRSNLLTALLSGAHEIPASYDDLIDDHLEAA